ncbi:MAG TPA: M20/M25/M40 family metallo-hydrolase [Actinomycetales bacterium]|nr:M20/M25/M40 family metallo-hydrolase [Actinomycetales bacterium]
MSDPGAEAVALLSELVGIDSVNPGLVSGAAGEQRIVEHLRARLERSGFATTVVPANGHKGRPSLIALPTGPANGPTVVLNGHLDTVGVTGMPDPFTARVEDDRLYGRGAADMKGGVAALVVAAECLVAAGAPVTPVLALVADEEDASLGSEAVIATLPGLDVRPDACLIAEPTDLALARSLRGFAVVRVQFAGRAAHSSQPSSASTRSPISVACCTRSTSGRRRSERPVGT